VLSANHDLHIPSASPAGFVPNIDRGTTATLSLPNDVVATLNCNLGLLPYLGFIPRFPRVDVTVECEGGKVELYNFVQPTMYHSIKVHKHDKTTRVEKVYKFTDAKMDGKGEDWWTTYRYQLGAFVDRLKGRTPQTWVDMQDSVANMEWIEKIYAKVRPYHLSSRFISSHFLTSRLALEVVPNRPTSLYQFDSYSSPISALTINIKGTLTCISHEDTFRF
jgi:hypothetical protein